MMFLWVGTGEMEEAIKEKIKNLGLEHNFRLVGSKPNVQDYLSAMDIFVLPSLWEGLGIVNIEAQTSGLITLCSNRVPIEAKVSDLIRFIDIRDNDVWCREIEDYIEKNDINKLVQLRGEYRNVNKEYDICNEALWLQEFYKMHWRGSE